MSARVTAHYNRLILEEKTVSLDEKALSRRSQRDYSVLYSNTVSENFKLQTNTKGLVRRTQ